MRIDTPILAAVAGLATSCAAWADGNTVDVDPADNPSEIAVASAEEAATNQVLESLSPILTPEPVEVEHVFSADYCPPCGLG